MNDKKFIFQNPVKIIQVFRKINFYDKSEKSFALRRVKMDWGKFDSKSGYLLNGQLFIPENILNDPDLINCNLITLNDEIIETNFHLTPPPASLPNYCLKVSQTSKIYIFRINQKENLELKLNYDYFQIGIPKRENFKICELKENTPVEIKINGKTDFSLSSRRGRSYKEQYYIFEYLGQFSECFLFNDFSENKIKIVPEDRKEINLIKPLW